MRPAAHSDFLSARSGDVVSRRWRCIRVRTCGAGGTVGDVVAVMPASIVRRELEGGGTRRSGWTRGVAGVTCEPCARLWGRGPLAVLRQQVIYMARRRATARRKTWTPTTRRVTNACLVRTA